MIDIISLSRKRNNPTSASNYLRVAILSILVTTLVSCGSKKPNVITTKAEARELNLKNPSSNSAVKSTSRSRRRKAIEEIDHSPEWKGEDINFPKSLATVDAAILYAMEYQGTRYRYGGSTKKGMDCSGLINISFDKAGEQVPRTSMSLFQATQPINIKEVQKGDLMFFATGRNRKKINHVALVTEVTPAEIRFIHATVSKGVTISSFNEPYWLGKYLSSGRLF